MPRVSRQVEIERRNKLIAVAEEMFLMHGYDNTTISDIVNRLELAKGTFYYHFRSKEALLVAVSEKLLSDTQGDLQSAHDAKGEDVYARIKTMLSAINHDVNKNEKIWKFVYHENNLTLYNQLIKTAMEKMSPLLAGVLEEGSAKGLLDVPHASEMAEALVILLDLYAKQICCEANPARKMRIHSTIQHILERMLDKECVPDFGIRVPGKVQMA